jgi:hypothetical protein
MNRVSVVTAFILVLFAACICQADTLVITYRSGKTQTIVLDEPSQGINSWQFVSGSVPQQQSNKQDSTPVKQEQVQKDPVSQPKADVKAAEKAPEKKSDDIRFKWNAKPIPD